MNIIFTAMIKLFKLKVPFKYSEVTFHLLERLVCNCIPSLLINRFWLAANNASYAGFVSICLGLYAFHILAYGWHSLRRPQRGLIGTYWTAQYSTNIDIANARVKRYSLRNRKK